MDPRLLNAAQTGDVGLLNDLIRSNPLILKEAVLQGAGHTPLHVACVAGHLDFIRELLKLMPELTENVNADGFSPLHIAAARGDVETVREILRAGGPQDLCLVKGRERRIPLHCAAANGKVGTMKELLSASPESVEETTAREETALHLSVKNNRFEALVVLVEHLKQHNNEQVINWKDKNGDTILHLAAAAKNFEVVDFMLSGPALKRNVIDVNALNESGLTALDVSSRSDREIRKILMRAENLPSSEIVLVDCQKDDVKAATSTTSLSETIFKIPETLRQTFRQWNLPKSSNQGQDTSNLPKDSNQGQDTSNLPKGPNQGQDTTVNPRDTLLVVATLIASATYQAVLQPPSFTPKADTSTKKGFLAVYASFMTSPVMRDLNYLSFMSGNTFGFLVSVQMIIYLTKKLPLRSPVLLATSAMVYSYFCFMWYMPFSDALGEKFSLMSVELLAVLPIVISISLLLLQKIIALGLKSFILGISPITMPSDMYSLDKSSDHSDSILLGLAKKGFDFFAKKGFEIFAKKFRQYSNPGRR